MKQKPNIVLFVADSFRGDVLGHLGNPAARTGAVDALVADSAVSFASTFSQSPVCTPSRCSFMTGWYPHVHGHRSMRNMLKPHEPNLLGALSGAGYRIFWGGKNDLFQAHQKDDLKAKCTVRYQPGAGYAVPALGDPEPMSGSGEALRRVDYKGVCHRRGGETMTIQRGDTAEVLAAVEWIRDYDGEDPFCCFLTLRLPHPPYRAADAHYEAIDPDLLPSRIALAEHNLPGVIAALREAYGSDAVTEDEWRELKRVYYAMCSEVDSLFGEVVQALKSKGVYDDTLVIFFSDHGDFAGDYGLPEKTHLTLQDPLVHVPLVIKPPRGVEVVPGVRRGLAELVDVSATVYDLAGIEPGYTCQGRSLAPALADPGWNGRDATFAEVGRRFDEVGFYNVSPDGQSAQHGIYGAQSAAGKPFHEKGSYAVMCRTRTFKYIHRPYTSAHELYNLIDDPGECINLSGDPGMETIERGLRERLLEFLMTTADVLPHELDPR